MTRIDNIIKGFNKMIKRLDEAAQFHANYADEQRVTAESANKLAERHATESARASALRSKIEGLITV